MKYTNLIIALSFFLFPTHLFAQADNECSAIADDTKRLSCYDNKAKTKDETDKDKQVIFDNDKWQVFEDSSKMDDSKTVMIILKSKNQISKRFGGFDLADITFRCKEKKTVLMLSLANNFLSDIQGYGDVKYRLDKDQPKTISMQTSTDNTTLGLWSGNKSIPFIKNMFGKKDLIIQATPFNESTYTLEFDISGIEDAIKPLREACGW